MRQNAVDWCNLMKPYYIIMYFVLIKFENTRTQKKPNFVNKYVFSDTI